MTDDTSNALDLAEAKHAELQARLDRAREMAAAHRTKAHELAFAAEGADDVDARRLSSKLLTDADKLDDDIKHRLEPAVAEAKRRVEAARKAEADATMRQRADDARALAMRLEAIGAGRDACFEQAKVLGLEFDAAMNELRRLGAPAPSAELVGANTTRALDAALAGLHPEARPVPPSQRHSFASLYRGWARPTIGWASKILEPAATDKHRSAAA